MEILSQIDALKEKAFKNKGFDGFLISNQYNLLYSIGVPGTACLLIPKNGKGTIYVYGVNYEEAKAEGKAFNVELVKRGENLIAKIAGKAKTSKIRKLAADGMSHETYQLLRRELKGRTKLKIQPGFVWDLRKVKDEKELQLMRKAGELTSIGLKAAYESVRPGAKEIQVAAEIEYAMRRNGSWGTAFETSVASGIRSAYPHGGCSDREIRKGDLVVVDIGAKYRDYCSDMTRTLVAGKPSSKQRRLHEIVKEAQEKAHGAIKPKAKARDVDTAARKVMEKAGYGEYFVHGLGHGVGLEVHELPNLSQSSKESLSVGNVVTNEPGIYLVGFGGIRIEDTVVVQKRKAEILTVGSYGLEPDR